MPSLSVRVTGAGFVSPGSAGGEGRANNDSASRVVSGSGDSIGEEEASTPKDQDVDPFAGLDTPTVGSAGGGPAKKLCMICMDRDRGKLRAGHEWPSLHLSGTV